MKAIIYTRVSSEDQVENTSLESQERICREYCRRHGLDVARVFSDRGESAKTADRPEFLAMIRFATTTPGITSAVVYKLDRFARNQFDCFSFINALAIKGISLRSATEQVTDGMEGKIMRSVLSLLAEIDNDIRADRSLASMRSLVAQGFWTHQAPLGYRPGRDSQKNPILVEDPVSGPIIKNAFYRLAQGQDGTVELACKLRSLGIKTRHGQPMNISAVHKMLRNEIYCGRITGRLTGGKTIRAAWIPLVTEEIFDRVQCVLNGRGVIQKPRERRREDLPLKGLIQCAECGRPLTASMSTGKSGARYGYYHCWNPECRRTRVSATALHQQTEDFFCRISASSSGRWDLFKSWVINLHRIKKQAVAKERTCARSSVDNLNAQLDRLLEKLLNGTIDDQTYKAKADQLKAELSTARTSANDIELEEMDIEGTLAYAEHMLANASSIWAKLNAKNKELFQRALFPAGLVYSNAGGLRTPSDSRIYGMLSLLDTEADKMATPTNISWNSLASFCRSIHQLREAIAA